MKEITHSLINILALNFYGTLLGLAKASGLLWFRKETDGVTVFKLNNTRFILSDKLMIFITTKQIDCIEKVSSTTLTYCYKLRTVIWYTLLHVLLYVNFLIAFLKNALQF